MTLIEIIEHHGPAAVAARLGFRSAYMSQIKHGRRRASAQVLRRAARAYGPDVLDLWGTVLADDRGKECAGLIDYRSS